MLPRVSRCHAPPARWAAREVTWKGATAVVAAGLQPAAVANFTYPRPRRPSRRWISTGEEWGERHGRSAKPNDRVPLVPHRGTSVSFTRPQDAWRRSRALRCPAISCIRKGKNLRPCAQLGCPIFSRSACWGEGAQSPFRIGSFVSCSQSSTCPRRSAMMSA